MSFEWIHGSFYFITYFPYYMNRDGCYRITVVSDKSLQGHLSSYIWRLTASNAMMSSLYCIWRTTFYNGGLDTMLKNWRLFVNLTHGRFEFDWHIWIFLGINLRITWKKQTQIRHFSWILGPSQNLMKNTFFESMRQRDKSFAWWFVWWCKFRQIRSERRFKIHEKCPIWVRFFAGNLQIDPPARSKCANHTQTVHQWEISGGPVFRHGVQATNIESHDLTSKCTHWTL